jgi:hypothetical protein
MPFSDLAPGHPIFPRRAYSVTLDVAHDSATDSLVAVNVAVTRR